MRLDYSKISPEAYKHFTELHSYLTKSSLSSELLDLVFLRVSVINGCSYCIDLHWRDAYKKGIDPRKLNGLSKWPDMPFFTDQERAALLWTEEVTNLNNQTVRNEVYDEVKNYFKEKDLVDLTSAISLMNAFNRLSISFNRIPEN